MAVAIINGRKITVPDSGVYGSELIKEARPSSGRRIVIPKVGGAATEFETVEPSKFYSKRDLINKKGNPVSIRNIPERIKGFPRNSFSNAITYGEPRSANSKKIITEQVYDVASKLFKGIPVDFDENNADWFIVSRYVLPKLWHNICQTSPLLIVFPTQYPQIAPIGFYLRASIPYAPNGNLLEDAYHNACKDPMNDGWKWYCAFVDGNNWQPSAVKKTGDWKYGDNLWTYLMLISEVLSNN